MQSALLRAPAELPAISLNVPWERSGGTESDHLKLLKLLPDHTLHRFRSPVPSYEVLKRLSETQNALEVFDIDDSIREAMCDKIHPAQFNWFPALKEVNVIWPGDSQPHDADMVWHFVRDAEALRSLSFNALEALGSDPYNGPEQPDDRLAVDCLVRCVRQVNESFETRLKFLTLSFLALDYSDYSPGMLHFLLSLERIRFRRWHGTKRLLGDLATVPPDTSRNLQV